MKWYAYIGYFFAGALLANFVPHFVMGITGQEFRTPFGDPSSATINILWGFLNLVAGYVIITTLGRLSFKFEKRIAATAIGSLTMAIMLSYVFG